MTEGHEHDLAYMSKPLNKGDEKSNHAYKWFKTPSWYERVKEQHNEWKNDNQTNS